MVESSVKQYLLGELIPEGSSIEVHETATALRRYVSALTSPATSLHWLVLGVALNQFCSGTKEHGVFCRRFEHVALLL